MNDEPTIDFCKVDSDLDANPKIRKAGAFGRDVFEFLLRVNRRKRLDGEIPLRYLEPGYLAQQLMLDRLAESILGAADTNKLAATWAEEAVVACVVAELLELDDEVARIVGWEEEWGTRQPKPVRERVRAHRARKMLPASPVTDSVTSNAGNAIRGEERRDQSLSPDSDIRPELPDPDLAAVCAERVEPAVLQPPPGIPMPGTRDRRMKLNHDAWTYAALEHSRLRGLGIDPNAIPWPSMPAGAAMHELVERMREVLTPDARGDGVGMTDEQARELVKRRIDVAVAEAKRDGHLRWFTPTRIFDSKSFWRAVELTPEQVTRAGPRGSPSSPAPTEPFRRSKNLS